MKFLNPETPDDGGHKRNERHYWQALATEMNILNFEFWIWIWIWILNPETTWWWWTQKKWKTLLTGVSYWDEYFWNVLPHSSSWGNQRSNVTAVHLQCVFQYFSSCWTFRPIILHLVSIFLSPPILWLWDWRLSSPGFEGESHFGLRWFTPTNEVSNIASKKRDKPTRGKQMSDFIQSMLYMSHEASLTIGVGLCQVDPIRICQKSYSRWLP